jgi:hypothetical protein
MVKRRSLEVVAYVCKSLHVLESNFSVGTIKVHLFDIPVLRAFQYIGPGVPGLGVVPGGRYNGPVLRFI